MRKEPLVASVAWLTGLVWLILAVWSVMTLQDFDNPAEVISASLNHFTHIIASILAGVLLYLLVSLSTRGGVKTYKTDTLTSTLGPVPGSEIQDHLPQLPVGLDHRAHPNTTDLYYAAIKHSALAGVVALSTTKDKTDEAINRLTKLLGISESEFKPYATAIHTGFLLLAEYKHVPASSRVGAHGGIPLYLHCYNVCESAFSLIPTFKYQGLANPRTDEIEMRPASRLWGDVSPFTKTNGNRLIHPLLYVLTALVHDIGKAKTFITEPIKGDQTKLQVLRVKGDHGPVGARWLASFNGFKKIPYKERAALYAAIAHYHQPRTIPGKYDQDSNDVLIQDDYPVALMMALIKADIAGCALERMPEPEDYETKHVGFDPLNYRPVSEAVLSAIKPTSTNNPYNFQSRTEYIGMVREGYIYVDLKVLFYVVKNTLGITTDIAKTGQNGLTQLEVTILDYLFLEGILVTQRGQTNYPHLSAIFGAVGTPVQEEPKEGEKPKPNKFNREIKIHNCIILNPNHSVFGRFPPPDGHYTFKVGTSIFGKQNSTDIRGLTDEEIEQAKAVVRKKRAEQLKLDAIYQESIGGQTSSAASLFEDESYDDPIMGQSLASEQDDRPVAITTAQTEPDSSDDQPADQLPAEVSTNPKKETVKSSTKPAKQQKRDQILKDHAQEQAAVDNGSVFPPISSRPAKKTTQPKQRVEPTISKQDDLEPTTATNQVVTSPPIPTENIALVASSPAIADSMEVDSTELVQDSTISHVDEQPSVSETTESSDAEPLTSSLPEHQADEVENYEDYVEPLMYYDETYVHDEEYYDPSYEDGSFITEDVPEGLENSFTEEFSIHDLDEVLGDLPPENFNEDVDYDVPTDTPSADDDKEKAPALTSLQQAINSLPIATPGNQPTAVPAPEVNAAPDHRHPDFKSNQAKQHPTLAPRSHSNKSARENVIGIPRPVKSAQNKPIQRVETGTGIPSSKKPANTSSIFPAIKKNNGIGIPPARKSDAPPTELAESSVKQATLPTLKADSDTEFSAHIDIPASPDQIVEQVAPEAFIEPDVSALTTYQQPPSLPDQPVFMSSQIDEHLDEPQPNRTSFDIHAVPVIDLPDEAPITSANDDDDAFVVPRITPATDSSEDDDFAARIEREAMEEAEASFEIGSIRLTHDGDIAPPRDHKLERNKNLRRGRNKQHRSFVAAMPSAPTDKELAEEGNAPESTLKFDAFLSPMTCIAKNRAKIHDIVALTEGQDGRKLSFIYAPDKAAGNSYLAIKIDDIKHDYLREHLMTDDYLAGLMSNSTKQSGAAFIFRSGSNELYFAIKR